MLTFIQAMSKFFLKSLFFLFFSFVIQQTSFATHVVGGEIMIEWTGDGNRYIVTLNKYSNVYGAGYVTNLTETVYFFDKRTNYQIGYRALSLMSNNVVGTNANYCTSPTLLQTSLQVYKGEIDISGIDPNGVYYVTWSDCCRNQDIQNIVSAASEDIVLYTEFRGAVIRNSTPKFAPLANEFFCRNNMNLFDLSAVDPDGDVLVYSLVSPKSSIAPDVDVVWVSPSSANDPIPGSVPFTIDANTGIASFNPFNYGIYVFGIKVEEYRNGQRIGEVRKDFQLNVQDCPLNNKPVIGFQNAAIREGDTLDVQLRGGTCFPMYVTDIDATQFFIAETIFINTRSTLPANSSNAPYPAAGFTTPAQLPLTGFRDTALFNACFDPCAAGLVIDKTVYYPFKIVINDNRCPAKYDTLIFTIKISPDNNRLPEVYIDPPANPKRIKVNEPLTFKVYGRDADAIDLLSLKLANPQRGMSFTNVQDSSLTISSTFSWTPNCNDLNPGTYEVYFIIKDNSCVLNPTDTVYQTIFVEQDEVSFETMLVTNLITPNGDGLNDYYHIPGIPEGNCDKYFKGINIYNRWGARVFYSQDRAFKWYPNVSDGMYYFSIDLNYEVRKGWLQITQ